MAAGRDCGFWRGVFAKEIGLKPTLWISLLSLRLSRNHNPVFIASLRFARGAADEDARRDGCAPFNLIAGVGWLVLGDNLGSPPLLGHAVEVM